MSEKTKSVLGIEKVIRQAWETTKANIWLLIGATLIIELTQTLPNISLSGIVENLFFIFIWNIGIIILNIWLFLGFIRILLNLSQNKETKIEDLFSQEKYILNFFIANVLYTLIIFGGLMLLIIPGIIWAIKFQFFTYFIVDKEMGPIEALKASSRITQGDKWNLFLLGILILLLILLGVLFLLVGLLVTYPLAILAMTYAYLNLKRAKFKKGTDNSPATA